ncbi:YecR family lipoprotein [Citrobacter sp. OP27]
MRKSLFALLAATLILSGCATKKQLVPTGGSKADGTVRMSYTYGMFEQPVVDPQQGVTAATARCSAWGYSGAEAFGGSTSVCSQMSSSGCTMTTVTTEYQCTGDLKK